MTGAPAAAETVVVHAGRLIADASQPASGPSTITIVDGRIQSVTTGLQPAPAGARLIDLSNRTVLPGLIDAHVHLSGNPTGEFWREAVEPDEWGMVLGVQNAHTTVRAGFTTVRDVGSAPQVGFMLRRGTQEGRIVGPRILASGPALSIIGGHGDVSGFRPEVIDALSVGNTCAGAEECAARVREALRAGADLIKFTATGGVLSQQGRGLEAHFTDEEMRAIVTTAHALGLNVDEVLATAGLAEADNLPTFRPYLRSKYPELPEPAQAELDRYFSVLAERYGINVNGPRAGEDEAPPNT
jgi:imidazolonepropionase-like amidohydrolase